MVLLFLFVFFGVIVMLNVFIALVNANYETASVEWLSVWRENRLRYVERAENMSYHITGFREYFDYFPEYIYFSPSEAEKAGFRDKYSLSYPPVDEDKVAQRHLELERLLLQLLSELKRQQQENQQEQALASESESQTQQELRQSNHTHNATDNNNGGGQGNLAANLGSWTLGATGSSSSVSAVTI
ncbi:hypothetical protein B0O80DRAFT_460670 [Mortierella sp. GBAus27b]|nr:hypothetical protein B0O80DRAFT_460670 [Mortierella sp. GBAus27b]